MTKGLVLRGCQFIVRFDHPLFGLRFRLDDRQHCFAPRGSTTVGRFFLWVLAPHALERYNVQLGERHAFCPAALVGPVDLCYAREAKLVVLCLEVRS